ncbi:MAG: ABC transporter ATP-binding protein [Nitrospira sp.]|nr:ABC transporter ATP-binding protein [Nitrospira sp.]
MSFGGLMALRNVSFDVIEGDIKALIGPNGAGKTTLLNIVSGIHQPDKGDVFFLGEKLVNVAPARIARKGISRTFQHVELFGNMTVIENIMVGQYARTRSGFLSSGFKLPFVVKEEREIQRKSEEILEYINLGQRKDEPASNLPIGEQRTLEIGRALATGPRLVLLDEPAAGLNIKETRNLGEIIRKIRDELKITVVLVEHDMDLVMSISDSIIVLNFGEVIAEGTPLEIQKNHEVIVAYLGEEEEIQRGYNAHT